MPPTPSPPVASRAQLVLATALALMRPLVRWMLRHGVTYTAFAAALKTVFVEAARDELAQRRMSATDSALSLLSGVHRRDVRELTRGDPPASGVGGSGAGLPAEVVGRWLSERRYLDARGRPRALRRDDAANGFDVLVGEISSDVRPKAVLDELLRLGVARVDDSGTEVRLLAAGFAPRQGFAEMAALLRENVGDHLSAACANLEEDRNFLEQSIFVDQITDDSAHRLHVVAAKAWRHAFTQVMREAQDRHAHDQQHVPASERVARARFGVYFYATREASDHD